jgi:hypothetical protein
LFLYQWECDDAVGVKMFAERGSAIASTL